MKKSLVFVSAVVVMTLATVAVLVETTAERRIPVIYRAGDLPTLVYHGRAHLGRVRVMLRFPAVPTDDPRVWEYRPSAFGTVPATLRFLFVEPPTAPFLIVEGETPHLSYDLSRRKNDVPGVVVISSCLVP